MSYFKNLMVIFSLINIVLSTGCASIVSGTHESISVTTPPIKGANCTLKNTKGIWYVPSTPGSVVVHKAYDDLVTTCEKSGYTAVTEHVKSKTRPAILGNALFGGAIGVSIDTVDGAAYAYPQVIMVSMAAKGH